MTGTRPFTTACLATIHLLKTAHADLAQMAYVTGRSPAECDRASWALLGSSIPDAVAALNRPQVVGGARG